MKKSVIIITFFLLLAQAVPAQTYLNNIGFDYFSPYMVKTPKYNLPGNKYNAYMNSTSKSFGLFYARAFKNHSFSLETGVYINTQFNSLVSFYVPVEFNGDVFGKSSETTLFAGYTVGFGLNFISFYAGNPVLLAGNVLDIDMSTKKSFYIAPHVGINAGINLNHLFFSFEGLFNFLVPEFVTYKTVYKNEQGKEITEINTNDNWGISLRAGIGFRF